MGTSNRGETTIHSTEKERKKLNIEFQKKKERLSLGRVKHPIQIKYLTYN